MAVADIQASAYSNAVNASNEATNFVLTAQSIINSLLPGDPFTPAAPTQVLGRTDIEALAVANRPVASSVASDLGRLDSLADPTLGALTAFTVPQIDNIPALNVVAPEITIPAAPDSTLPDAPVQDFETRYLDLPATPTFTLPDAPSFTPVVIPEPQMVEVPTFDMAADFGDLVEPSTVFNFSEADYQSVLLDEVKNKILYDLINGGYGIDEDDERRLWDRARERELVNAQATMEEISRTNAARGFALPQGSLYAQMSAAEQDLLEKGSSLSRDIASKRADLYVENRRFMIDAARQVEGILIQHAGTVAERALNAARATAEFGIQLFNVQVAKYNAKLDAFRTYAAAFESRVRAALAGVEIFKSRVESARLSIDAQRAHAEVYNTQIEGVQALIGLYRSQVEAVQTAAQIEQIKLEGFRTRVSAYAEQVRARGVEFEMFRAQLAGEQSKVDVYRTQVEAYSAALGGIETQARIADTKARVEIAQAQNVLETYRTEIEAYRAKSSVINDKIAAILEADKTYASVYTAYMGALGVAADHNARTSEAQARVDVAYQSLLVENIKRRTEELVSIATAIAGTNQNAANTLAQLGSSWASSVVGLSADIQTA